MIAVVSAVRYHRTCCGIPAFETPFAGEAMRLQELRSRLHGVIAFPVTPFKPDLSLDISGLRRNLRQLLQYPIAAIVAAGGTGEMYSLTPSEHEEVVKATLDEVRGRIPVIAGTGFNQQMAELMRLMNDYVIPLYALRSRRRGYEVSAMKAMMNLAGLAGGPVRPPLPNLRPEEVTEVKTMLERWRPVLT